MRGQRRPWRVVFHLHGSQHAGARFGTAHRVQGNKTGQFTQAGAFIGFIVAQARPWLKPAFAGESHFPLCPLSRLCGGTGEVHR